MTTLHNDTPKIKKSEKICQICAIPPGHAILRDVRVRCVARESLDREIDVHVFTERC